MVVTQDRRRGVLHAITGHQSRIRLCCCCAWTSWKAFRPLVFVVPVTFIPVTYNSNNGLEHFNDVSIIISTPNRFEFIGCNTVVNSSSCPQPGCSKEFLMESTLSGVHTVVLPGLLGHSLLHHGLHHRLQGTLCSPYSCVGAPHGKQLSLDWFSLGPCHGLQLFIN